MKYTNIDYIDFSNLYESESKAATSTYGKNGICVTRIDVSHIDGTNCYCDDVAAQMLREVLSGVGCEGIHFLDSGNYHYASLFFLEKIKYDFGLVFVDDHPDLQQSAFGDILSCGGWVRTAIDSVEHLKKVYMLGVDPELIEEVSPLPDKVQLLNDIKDISKIKSDHPIYISVDKDALCPKYAACDWSQGTMKLDELLTFLKELHEKYDVIGVDICGEKKNGARHEELVRNMRTNKRISNVLLDL